MIINILSIVTLVILLRWVSTDIMMPQRKKVYFVYCIILTMIIVAAELGCLLTDNTIPENRRLSIFFNMLGFSLSSFVFIMESNFYYVEKNILYYVPPIINLVMTLASPYFGWIFFIKEDCSYHRGKFFIVYLIVFLYSVIFSLGKKLYVSKNYPVYFRKRIIESGVVMVIGIIIQVVLPQYHTTWMIITIYLVLYYALSCQMGSLMDGLTGLLNRTAFNKQMEHLKFDTNRTTVLFMIDINDFKLINDTRGHTYGDFYLREIGKIMKTVFSINAQIFRFGGDEFSVILSMKLGDSIDSYVDKLDAILKNKQTEDEDFPDLAVGYSIFEENTNIRDTIDLADNNMYENKRVKKKV